MLRIHLTLATVAAMLDSIVERFGADHRPTSDTGSGCTYFYFDGHRMVAVCLIGQVVSDLGALRALAVADYDSLSQDARAYANANGGGQWGSCTLDNRWLWESLEAFGITADDDAKALMVDAQRNQDAGDDWGHSVSEAKSVATARLRESIDAQMRQARLDAEAANSEAFAALRPLPEPLADWERDLLQGGHESRVQAALDSSMVIGLMREGKRIPAIKEIRNLTGCGLKEAKDVTFDARLGDFFGKPLI